MPPQQVRPASAASLRLGHRPLSRLGPSPLSSARQKALAALTRTLAQRVSCDPDVDPERLNSQVDRMVALLTDTPAAPIKSSKREIDASYQEYERRVRVTHSAKVADALRVARERLGSLSVPTAQQPTFLEILHFLLIAANPPEHDTMANAAAARSEHVNTSSVPTWDEIMNDPPFEGEHWREDDGSSSSDESQISTFSFSPPPSANKDTQEPPPSSEIDRLRVQRDVLADRATVEQLCRRQYWKSTQPVNVDRFNSANPSSLCTALTGTFSTADTEVFMTEADLIRECLLLLQGYPSILGKNLDSSPPARLLRHISPASLTSTLMRISALQAKLDRLRSFVNFYTPPSTQGRRSCQTLEAFASALDDQLAAFLRTCSQKEEALSRAHGSSGISLPVSLLGLLHDLRPSESLFAALDGLLHDLCDADPEHFVVANLARKLSETRASVVVKQLLDELYFAVQARLAVGDEVTAGHLCRVLCITADPVWSMCASWLHDGMTLHEHGWAERGVYGADGEFFIEHHDLSPSSPDFWASGYTLRKGNESDQPSSLVPVLFSRLSFSLLATGKAVGLLRIMGVIDAGHSSTQDNPSWRNVESLLRGSLALSSLGDGWMAPRALEEHLQSRFDSVQRNLTQIIIDRCQLLQSLKAMESLSFMSRSDIMSEWCDRLFSKVDNSGRSWADFHFLNSAFRDVIAHEADLNAEMVRLSYNGHRASSATSSVRGFEGLRVEYITQFPLNYVFNGDAMNAYSRIFTLLVQIRRAQRALDEAFLCVSSATSRYLHSLRHHLSWILGVLVNFFSTTLYSQVVELDGNITKATSFDEILLMHEQHLQNIQTCFLLQRETRALHANIVAILDLCLRFHFLARTIYAPLAPRPKRRNRRTTTRRRVVAFALSDSESDTDDVDAVPPAPVEPKLTNLGEGLEQDALIEMHDELVKEMLNLRQGVESLAAQATSSAALFSSIVFGLQAWHP